MFEACIHKMWFMAQTANSKQQSTAPVHLSSRTKDIGGVEWAKGWALKAWTKKVALVYEFKEGPQRLHIHRPQNCVLWVIDGCGYLEQGAKMADPMQEVKGYWCCRWPPWRQTSDSLRWTVRHGQSSACCRHQGEKHIQLLWHSISFIHSLTHLAHALHPLHYINTVKGLDSLLLMGH